MKNMILSLLVAAIALPAAYAAETKPVAPSKSKSEMRLEHWDRQHQRAGQERLDSSALVGRIQEKLLNEAAQKADARAAAIIKTLKD
jgi:hypothetical protein